MPKLRRTGGIWADGPSIASLYRLKQKQHQIRHLPQTQYRTKEDYVEAFKLNAMSKKSEFYCHCIPDSEHIARGFFS